jgi:Right handed beta helix region
MNGGFTMTRNKLDRNEMYHNLIDPTSDMIKGLVDITKEVKEIKDSTNGVPFKDLATKEEVNKVQEGVKQAEVNVRQPPFNCPNDGSKDVTSIINDAITYATENGYNRVRIPSGLYMVDGSSDKYTYEGQFGAIKIPSNLHLLLDSDTVIKQVPTEHPNYNIIYFSKAENSSITGGVIEGDRNDHLGTEGELGFGIGVFSSRNILIESVTCKDCWGDGIVLNHDWGVRFDDSIPYYEKQNYNVTIRNVICDNNRRQGCSIESVIGGLIENSTFSNTNGTFPECGIDVEPFNPIKAVEDLTFKNNLFENNNAFGLLLLNNTVQRITVEGNFFNNNKSAEGQLGAKNTSKVVVTNNTFNAAVSGGGTKFTLCSEFLVTSNKYIDCWHGFYGTKNSEFKNNQVTFNAREAYNYLVINTQDATSSSEINIANNRFESLGVICKSYAVLARGLNLFIDNNYIGQAYGTMDVSNDSYVEFKNNFVIDMSIQGINVGAGAARIENNTFSGICYLNNAQSILRVRDNAKGFINGNSFYKNRIGGGDKGTGRPSSYVRIEALGNVEAFNNFTDSLSVINLSVDSILSERLPYTFGTTANRPTKHVAGRVHFDTTLNTPVWSNGTAWVDPINDRFKYKEDYGTEPPTTGKWNVMDRRHNTDLFPGGYMGWVCTQAGEFGKAVEPIFKPFGLISE